jgi:aspartate kinase
LQSNSFVEQGLPFDQAFAKVAERYEDIGKGLRCHSSVVGWLSNVYEGIQKNEGKDWVASRGEWLMAQIFARFLGRSFVDAANLIRFKENGEISVLSYDIIKQQLAADSVYYVIPGFYGTNPSGRIQIFERGGSDITGAIIARGVNASLYENWTDVNGLMAADPKYIDNPKTVREITYREMRELGYRGVDVLQRDSVLPVFEAGIPINIRNTFNTSDSGTFIRRERVIGDVEDVVAIAGRKGFMAIQIEKFGMNEQAGVGSRVLDIFREYGLPFENIPMGLDEMSIIVQEGKLRGKEQQVVDAITAEINPTAIKVIRNLGLICLVGEGLRQRADRVISEFSGALSKFNINIRTLSYGTSGNNIVIGVDDDKVHEAIRVLYDCLL